MADVAEDGRSVRTTGSLGPSRPGIAALLSLVLPGLGQAWVGAVRRGLLFAGPLVVLAGLVALLAIANPKAIINAVVQPSVILGLLVVIIGLGLYHVAAITDAYRTGWRRQPQRPIRMSRRSPLLAVAVVVAVAVYGGIEVIGVHAYNAALAIFAPPDSGFTIPEASFEPTPTATPAASPAPGTAGPTATPAGPTPTPPPAWAADGRLNLLLIGSDAGPGRWMLRTDTMIVLSVDIASHRAALFGIPRNIVNVPLPPESAGAFTNGRYPFFLNSLYVYAMQHPSKFPGGDARGFRAVSGAIQELVGVPLDGAVVVDLNGFVDLVNAVGGLWINVPQELTDSRYPLPDGSGYIAIDIKAGCQHMNGDVALEYARSRHQDDDYFRMRRQQAVILALHRELDPIALLPRVPDLLDIAKDNLWTTIQQNEIADLAVLAAHVDTGNIDTIQFSPPTYPEYLTTTTIKHIQTVTRTVFDEPASATTPPPTATPRPCPKS